MAKRVWTCGDKLQVMAAAWKDKGYSANVDIKCPICETDSLSYDNPNPFDMSAWCSNCESGMTQGKGAKVDVLS